MKRTIFTIISMTIIIGILGLCFNSVFGNQTIVFVQKNRVDILNTHFFIWKFDFWAYIKNIELSVTDLSTLIFELPSRQWEWMDDIADFSALGNDMALILDYAIMILNIMLYPFRIGAYMMQNVMAILGINTDVNNQYNGMAWLVTFNKEILRYMTIPYV